MGQRAAGLLIALGLLASCSSRPEELAIGLCDLSRDYGAYRNKSLAVRGVVYYGLRQTCQATCATRRWPSFVDLVADRDDAWNALAKIEQAVEREAKKGKRFEIWVTAHGTLNTQARRLAGGPCDEVGSHYFGYGHLGAFPAELVVTSFSDIQVIENADSPYDYADIYHGAL
ncbi:MAG TPA: hypothetical protein VMU19_00965 [Bryobacteraceae bacterium]|nr:hypothetical protein [Bryobacteraceae bacterium]